MSINQLRNNSAANDPRVASDFTEILRADSVTILVDGDRLSQPAYRHNTKSEVLMMLQGLIDGDAITGRPSLAIVLTKLDIVLAREAKKTEVFFEALVQSMRDRYGSHFRDVVTFRVAANPTGDITMRGFGVDDLLTFWSAPPWEQPLSEYVAPVFSRAFHCLQEA